MSAPVELLPMYCTRCQFPIPAQSDEVAWICEHCGQGVLLWKDHDLVPIDVHFAANPPAGAPEQPLGKPFWVTTGKVEIRRTTFHGDRSGEMLAFWQTERHFFIPAYNLELEEVVRLGCSLLRQPPALTPGSPVKFLPVTVPPDDMRPLAEFIILAVEAERKDDLKTIDFQLELQPPQLWVLP